MIDPSDFYNFLKENKIQFYCGVPDSLLKDICSYITDNVDPENNVITSNEGAAIALGAGYHLATNKIPLIYMQNSGLGNAVNPLLSLADKNVYSIPMLLMIGWRGEPGIKDEPQHFTQGEVTLKLLDTMKIPYEIIPENFIEACAVLKKCIDFITLNKTPISLIIRKNIFKSYKLQKIISTNFEMNREDAVKLIIDSLDNNDIVVSTTGKTSREVFEYREELNHGHKNDFLTVGSMGHSSQIALGIAKEKYNRDVYCIDGDGAILMHTGSLGIIGQLSLANFKHIIINNGSHDSVGGQPTIGFDIKFTNIAKEFNYKQVFYAESRLGLVQEMDKLKKAKGPAMLEIKVNKGARFDLGRPTTSPIENKLDFMNFLSK